MVERLDKIARDELRHRMVPLVDDYFSRDESLANAGWLSYRPQWQFEASFCTEEAWAAHRRYVVERNKEEVSGGTYKSPLIATLLDEYQRSNPGPDSHFDECNRNFLTAQHTNFNEYLLRRRPYVIEQEELRQQEMRRHAAITLGNPEFDADRIADRMRVFKTVMEEAGASLGFTQSKRISTKVKPIFVKAIHKPWVICINFDTRQFNMDLKGIKAYSPYQVVPVTHMGTFLPELELRRADKSGATASKDAELCLYIPLREFFPVRFEYRNFRNLVELETNVRLWLFMYKTIHEQLEATLKEGLEVLF